MTKKVVTRPKKKKAPSNHFGSLDVPTHHKLPLEDRPDPDAHRRSRKLQDIIRQYNEFHEKVWYQRNLVSGHRNGAGKQGMDNMEKKYGKKHISQYSDFEWGLISGRLSALSWVLGSRWEESLDS